MHNNYIAHKVSLNLASNLS